MACLLRRLITRYQLIVRLSDLDDHQHRNGIRATIHNSIHRHREHLIHPARIQPLATQHALPLRNTHHLINHPQQLLPPHIPNQHPNQCLIILTQPNNGPTNVGEQVGVSSVLED